MCVRVGLFTHQRNNVCACRCVCVPVNVRAGLFPSGPNGTEVCISIREALNEKPIQNNMYYTRFAHIY